MIFRVEGIPAPKGSTRAFMRPGMKHPVVISDNKRTKPWEQAVRAEAQIAEVKREDGPVSISLVFVFARPKGHFGKRGLLPSAPIAHLVKPDVDKLARAALDALTGTAFTDDSQVVRLTAMKRYAVGDEPIGMVAEVSPLHEQPLATQQEG